MWLSHDILHIPVPQLSLSTLETTSSFDIIIIKQLLRHKMKCKLWKPSPHLKASYLNTTNINAWQFDFILVSFCTHAYLGKLMRAGVEQFLTQYIRKTCMYVPTSLNKSYLNVFCFKNFSALLNFMHLLMSYELIEQCIRSWWAMVHAPQSYTGTGHQYINFHYMPNYILCLLGCGL